MEIKTERKYVSGRSQATENVAARNEVENAFSRKTAGVIGLEGRKRQTSRVSTSRGQSLWFHTSTNPGAASRGPLWTGSTGMRKEKGSNTRFQKAIINLKRLFLKI